MGGGSLRSRNADKSMLTNPDLSFTAYRVLAEIPEARSLISKQTFGIMIQSGIFATFQNAFLTPIEM